MSKAMSEIETDIMIPSGKEVINGNLSVPEVAKAVVLFAHGSGSSRFSPRNRQVAAEINKVGMATLLVDLLTRREEEVDVLTAEYRFDIDLLARRSVDATIWLKKNPSTRSLDVGYFGSSTGAAAALIAAAKLPDVAKAVVSRGGRPDLAGAYLSQVRAPTLLIVGGDDDVVIGLNREAMKSIVTEKKLEIVLGATHLFEEPGKLEEVSRLAIGWFVKYLGDR